MSQPLVYIDRSDVLEGALDALKDAIAELAEFIEANEPQLLAYNAYISDDGSEMTVVHVHADAASLDRHMEVAGPAFRRFADLVALRSIHIYGEPSEQARERLHEKALLLGSAEVIVQQMHAGFSRFPGG